MNFQDAEKTYKDFKAQHAAAKLNDAAFEAEVAKLRLQDDQGRWWQIGVQTGEWYMHDGQKWSKAKPPAPSAPVVLPVSSPEKPTLPAVTPLKPAPDKKVEAAPTAEPAAKEPRASAMPRLFSPKPAGREGGLPRRVLIGIIAAIAVVLALVLIAGYFILRGSLSTTKATLTPTRAVAALPTLPPPTLAPLATLAPTLAPLPTFAPVVTATLPLTATTPVTRTRVAATATPKKPATPVGPTPTHTPNVPPGVYAVKLEPFPANPSLGSTIGFKVTLLNTTGATQTFNWIVKVYQCPEQCQNFRNSFGETLRFTSNVPPGTVVLTSSQNINLGPGIRCNLVAIPGYFDPVSQGLVFFSAINNNALYQNIQICQ